jgi:methylenetetrahydrofolate reductase (NADPH)
MKVSQIKDFFISVEIIPPLRGKHIKTLFKPLDKIMKFNPAFISITKHPPQLKYYEIDGKIFKLPKVKRPGTLGVAAALKQRYSNVEIIPHIVCYGMSKFEVEELLIDLDYIGIENVFVIRGDKKNKIIKKDDQYDYAYQLVKQIKDMNEGNYLYPIEDAHKTNFCVGVAGYPEKHYEALNMKDDLKNLKLKVDSGANFVITQMFFSVDKYINFVEEARKMGITIPIIPGIKPIISYESARNIPGNFYIDIPEELVKCLEDAKSKEEEFKIGIKYTLKLIEELRSYGIPGIHFFTMSRSRALTEILKNI